MIPKHTPGILSDRQIRELCVRPTFVVNRRSISPNEYDSVGDQVLRFNEEFSWKTHEELQREMKAYHAENGRFTEGIAEFRELSKSELNNFKPMISPFEPNQVRKRKRKATEEELIRQVQDAIEMDACTQSSGMVEEKIVSYGLTSFGYDVRCGNEFKIFTNVNSSIVDPKNFDEKSFVDFTGDVCIIPPNSFVLARTVERFCMPPDIVANCLGKSTYARCGISIMVTPLEPGWEGYLTLEFANTTPLPAKLYANEGCGQVQFFRGSEPCEVAYNTRGGKYMDQAPQPITPRM